MVNSIFLALVSLLPSLTLAQSGGTWHMNVTAPSSGAGPGCIILAQIASLTSTNTITAMKPICPKSSPNPPPLGGETVTWPISTDGDGAASSLAIYADIPLGDGTVKPGCAMILSQKQVAYILGRDLLWNSNLGQVWDFTGDGFLLEPVDYATMTWYVFPSHYFNFQGTNE